MIYTSEENHRIIDYSNIIGYSCLIKVTPWEKGITWESLANGERIFQESYLDELGIAFHQAYHNKQSNNWLKTIPKDFISKLLDYEKNYRLSVYSLLYLLSRYQSAADLFKNNQKLMAIFMYSAKLNNWDEKHVASLLNKKRIDILSACGFSGTKSALKTLNKLEAFSLSYTKYLTVKNVLSLPNIHLINHLNYIDIYLLQFIENHNDVLSSSIIKSYCKQSPISRLKDLYIHTHRMLGEQGNRQLMECRTIDELEAVYYRCIFSKNKEKRSKKVIFPLPPLQGNENIIPITNSHELQDEGQDQCHCVASYKSFIVRGEIYIYKVLKPERTTLSVKISANGTCKIDQIRLSHNKIPATKTIKVIDTWINEASKPHNLPNAK